MEYIVPALLWLTNGGAIIVDAFYIWSAVPVVACEVMPQGFVAHEYVADCLTITDEIIRINIGRGFTA